MDARTRRSRTALVDAAYRLASERNIDDLTVTDLTNEAGVSRDTFYRHATDPVDLLATALHAELRDELGQFHAMPRLGDDGGHVFREPTRVFVEHLRAHAAVYRRALAGGLGLRLLTVLTDEAGAVLASHLRRHPDIAPASLDVGKPAVFDMAVAYAAGGTVAAAQAWLLRGDIDDVDTAVETIIAAAPRWWLAGFHPSDGDPSVERQKS